MKYRKKLVLKKKVQTIVENIAFIGIALMACTAESDSLLPLFIFASFTIPYFLLMRFMKYDD